VGVVRYAKEESWDVLAWTWAVCTFVNGVVRARRVERNYGNVDEVCRLTDKDYIHELDRSNVDGNVLKDYRYH